MGLESKRRGMSVLFFFLEQKNGEKSFERSLQKRLIMRMPNRWSIAPLQYGFVESSGAHKGAPGVSVAARPLLCQETGLHVIRVWSCADLDLGTEYGVYCSFSTYYRRELHKCRTS